MFTKRISRSAVAVVAGLSLLTFGLGLYTATAVQADTQPNVGRTCGLDSAKNTSYFANDTTFSIRTHTTLYTYKCGGDAPRWTETITVLFPPITAPNSGVFEAAP